MVKSILLKFLTLGWDISRTIWRIEVSDGSLFYILHSLSLELNLLLDQSFPSGIPSHTKESPSSPTLTVQWLPVHTGDNSDSLLCRYDSLRRQQKILKNCNKRADALLLLDPSIFVNVKHCIVLLSKRQRCRQEDLHAVLTAT